MVGRAPGGNGCPGSLEVTALRWLRGHSWLNSWFFRGGPLRSLGSAVTTPRQGPPSKLRPACVRCLRHRVLRHVPSSWGTIGRALIVSRSLPRTSFCPFPRRSLLSVLSLFHPLVIADFLHSTFLNNLLILMR